MINRKKIAQEILDVLVKYNLSLKQSGEILGIVSYSVSKEAVLPKKLPVQLDSSYMTEQERIDFSTDCD